MLLVNVTQINIIKILKIKKNKYLFTRLFVISKFFFQSQSSILFKHIYFAVFELRLNIYHFLKLVIIRFIGDVTLEM